MTNKYLMKEGNLHQDWVCIYRGLVPSQKRPKFKTLKQDTPIQNMTKETITTLIFLNTCNKHDCLQFPYKDYTIDHIVL